MSSWDDFQIVGELQEQNQNLLLQLDAKDRELREVQNYVAPPFIVARVCQGELS